MKKIEIFSMITSTRGLESCRIFSSVSIHCDIVLVLVPLVLIKFQR